MKLQDHARLGLLPDFGNFYTNHDTSVGIEHEGHAHTEMDGIARTKRALEEVRAKLSA